MDSENKDLEIVMGDDTELNFSEVGDMVNNLRPNTSEKKTNIIIPLIKKKADKAEDEYDEEDDDDDKTENKEK